MVTGWCCLLSFAFLAFPVAGAFAEDSPHTNILLIVTDDQRWDQLGVVQRERGEDGRFPFLETPRLDAFAAQGMRFRNAFVTTSLCSPSRAAILTGQYNHTNGIIDNVTPFPDRPTWASALRDAGYTTAFIGKWHHGEEQWDRPGFDHVATFRGQGDYEDATFKINNSWFNTRTKGYADARSVDFAIEYLEDQGDEPFAMMVGFKAVHQPFTPMKEHADDYASETMKTAPNWSAIAPWKNRGPMRLPRSPRFAPVWMDILRSVKGIDANVGRLLDALDELHLAENTLVIFTSDNGFYLGEHQLATKRSAYEESIRVPLLVRLPGIVEAGGVSDELVLNIDLAPTILEVANTEPGYEMQGASLKPLLAGGAAHWREAFLYEYFQDYEFWKTPRVPRTPSVLAVRTATHKLVTYPDFENWTQLFDLEADPYETRNLVGYQSETARHVEMCELLEQLLRQTDFVDRGGLNKWLIGLTESWFTYQEHASTPVDPRRPPLLHPTC